MLQKRVCERIVQTVKPLQTSGVTKMIRNVIITTILMIRLKVLSIGESLEVAISFLDLPIVARSPFFGRRRGQAKGPRPQSALPSPGTNPALGPLKLRLPQAVAPPSKETDSAPFAPAGILAAQFLPDNPSPMPEIPELFRPLPDLPRAPGEEEEAKIAEGHWPRPLRRLGHPHPLPAPFAPPPPQPPARAGVPDPGPSLPPPFSLPAFPALPQWRVGGSRPVSSFLLRATPPPIKHPSPHRPLPPWAGVL